MEKTKQQQFKIVDSQSVDTTADYIKYCPFEQFKHYFLIAFYQLNEELQQAFGGMRVYNTEQKKLDEIQRVESGGVLDFVWIEQLIDEKIYFMTAQCDSLVKIYEFDPINSPNIIKEIKSFEIEIENEAKCLYIDVNVKDNIIYAVISTDIETVHILQLSCQGKFEEIQREEVRKHEFSVWACCVSKQNPEYQYLSGGDDCKLNVIDTRMPNKIGMVNKNSHIQGITCIYFSPHDDNMFVTGSYDENVRIFDLRKFQDEVYKSKRAGGVWRTVFDKNNKNNMLVGVYSEKYFEILDYNNDFQVVQKFEGKHDSLAYSCDYSFDSSQIVTNSFYDKQMHLWDINSDKE